MEAKFTVSMVLDGVKDGVTALKYLMKKFYPDNGDSYDYHVGNKEVQEAFDDEESGVMYERVCNVLNVLEMLNVRVNMPDLHSTLEVLQTHYTLGNLYWGDDRTRTSRPTQMFGLTAEQVLFVANKLEKLDFPFMFGNFDCKSAKPVYLFELVDHQQQLVSNFNFDVLLQEVLEDVKDEVARGKANVKKDAVVSLAKFLDANTFVWAKQGVFTVKEMQELLRGWEQQNKQLGLSVAECLTVKVQNKQGQSTDKNFFELKSGKVELMNVDKNVKQHGPSLTVKLV